MYCEPEDGRQEMNSVEVMGRAVHHRTPVLAGLAAVDCVILPSLSERTAR